MKYPDVIEVPGPEDFCKGQAVNGTRRCTSAWMRAHFGRKWFTREWTAWHDAADDAGIPKPSGKGAITERNDHLSTTFEQLSIAYEGMLKRLGYEIEE